jgi:hypothetical protein
MTNYGQTSKELEEEYEREEEPIEKEYKIFPKKHNSLLPNERFGVKLPNTNSNLNVMLGVKLPRTDMHDTTPYIVSLPNSLKKRY